MRFAIVDIETRIDKRLVRDALYAGEQMDEQQAYLRLRDELGGGFFPTSLHVPISIAVGNVNDDHILESVENLAAERYSEVELVREFWRRAEHFGGCLVTFNGRGFDLPVLELQALRHGISAPAHFAQRPRPLRRSYHLDLQDFLTNRGDFSNPRRAQSAAQEHRNARQDRNRWLPGAGAFRGRTSGRNPSLLPLRCHPNLFFVFARSTVRAAVSTRRDIRRRWKPARASSTRLAQARRRSPCDGAPAEARLIVISRNEEALIGDCLRSAAICDERIVIDSFSTDRTVEIALGLGARVFQRGFEGYLKQKQFALEQATADWVLSLDADEQLTHGLRQEIAATIGAPIRPTATRFAGFSIIWIIIIRERPIRTVICACFAAKGQNMAGASRMPKL